jgi:thiamine pyrophosphate-dependent acetolactate synthase large subunit-like protein
MEDTGVLISIADAAPQNLVVIVFDNESYARMGPTATSRNADLARMAKGAGIRSAVQVRTLEGYEAAVKDALAKPGPAFILAKVEAETQRIPDSRVTYGSAMKEHFVERVTSHPDYGAWKRG